jgi:adenylate cyclase
MGADEEGTLAVVTAHTRQFIIPRIAEHRGRLTKTPGDGDLAECASIADAMPCAFALQEGMRSRNAGTPERRQILFRIDLDIGNVIAQGDDALGEGVNVAAWL